MKIGIGASALNLGIASPTIENVTDNVGNAKGTVIVNGATTDDATPTFVINTPKSEAEAEGGVLTWTKVNVMVDGNIVDTIQINQTSGQVVWSPKTALSLGQHDIQFSLVGTAVSGTIYESPSPASFKVNVSSGAIVNAWNANIPGVEKIKITSPDTTEDTNQVDYTGMQTGVVSSGDANISKPFTLSQFSDANMNFSVTIQTPSGTGGAKYKLEVILEKNVNGVWSQVNKGSYTLDGAFSTQSGSTNTTQNFKLSNLTNQNEEYRIKLVTSNIGTTTSYDKNVVFAVSSIDYTVTHHKLTVPSDKSTAYGVDGTVLPSGKSSTDYDIWIKTTDGYQKVTTTGKTTFNLSNALFHISKEGDFNFDPVNKYSNIGKVDGFEYKLVDKASGLETYHRQEIEIRADGVIINYGEAANTDTANLVGTSSSDVIISGTANDKITSGSGQDWLVYNVLKAGDATGGNGSDTWTDFNKANVNAGGDVIDISSLFVGQTVTMDNIGQFVSVESGTNTVIKIDRDGADGTHTSTTLITLTNVNTSLEELLKNGQLHF